MESLEVVENLNVGGDVITKGEFVGKNACTAWVNFDGTTTPPTIRDSFNVSDVVRTATGKFEIYFEKDMSIDEYVTLTSLQPANYSGHYDNDEQTIKMATIRVYNTSTTLINREHNNVVIFGGKN
jgi:hypothetical protein